jgi:hypothetical protein
MWGRLRRGFRFLVFGKTDLRINGTFQYLPSNHNRTLIKTYLSLTKAYLLMGAENKLRSRRGGFKTRPYMAHRKFNPFNPLINK